jgi:hypothetical protein
MIAGELLPPDGVRVGHSDESDLVGMAEGIAPVSFRPSVARPKQH